MDPATILLVMQAIQAVLVAAPQAMAVIEKAKEFIAALFGDGLITTEQQDRMFKRVDEICAAAIAGKEPSHWTVEPDPV